MKKKGLVARLIMNNPSDVDFSYDKLPKNRRELLLYMLKNKFWKIYKNHLVMALFFIPLVAWRVLTMSYSNFVFSLDFQEKIANFADHWLTVYVTAIPLWAIAFVGLAGGLNVIRKLAWSDPVTFKTDFFKGIKASGKQLALIGALWGIAYSLIRYALDWLNLYFEATDGDTGAVFGIFVCYFVLLFAIGLTVYSSCMASLYNVTLKQLFVGAFKLYFADFFLATGVILLCLVPFVILAFASRIFVILLGYLFILGLLIGFVIIPPFLVCQHTFDRVINKKDYPNYYGRGLSYGTYGQDKAPEMIIEDDVVEEDLEDDFERVNDGED